MRLTSHPVKLLKFGTNDQVAVPDNQNDAELLQRVSSGDETAFRELYEKYAALLYHFLHQHFDDTASADDLVQDIFTQVWLTRESLASIRRFGAFLFVLAKRAVLNHIKKKIRERKRTQEYASRMQVEENEPAETDAHLNIVEQAIARLPEQQKKVWIYSRREGLSYADIAGEMSISRETVKKYLQLANASITKYVEQHIDIVLLILLTKIS
jgi:RNA polymerase sigma-70 factor (family 1)